MKTLTDCFVFKCNLGEAIFKAADNSHRKMSSTGARILTSNSTLTGSGICPNLGPGPCAFAPAGSWLRTDRKITVNSFPTLTDKSCIMCAIGGTIKPFNGMTKVSVHKAPVIPSFTAAPDAVPLSNAAAPSAGAVPEGNGIAPAVKSNSNFPETQDIPEKNIPESDAPVSEPKETVQEHADADEVIPEFPYALCDYKNCPDWRTCEYLKADYSPASVNNSSYELEKNFKASYPQKYSEYCALTEKKNAESTEGCWGKAAHHIISGNQIFAPHPYLVKLANYYGYDINNADNCILLPTTHHFDSDVKITRQANAYAAMSYMAQQWHVGGHAYPLDKNTVANIFAYLEKTSDSNIVFYKHYVDAVEHEMGILEAKYKKFSCRLRDYETKKRRFIENMNAISGKIGEKLLDFRKGAKMSFPYYVSREAIHYAFDIPRKKKFILVYRRTFHGNEVTAAAKMTVNRLQKDKYQILFTDSDEHIINAPRNFILFAENVRFFIIGNNCELPWRIDPSREYTMRDSISDVSTYCSSFEHRIISFVEGRDASEMNYEPPGKVIRQRLADINGGIV